MGRIDISKTIKEKRQKVLDPSLPTFFLPKGMSSRRKPRHEESGIQQSCVRWFRYAFPQYVILSIPNGGSRNVIEAANLKKEGALAGASDLMVIAERRVLFVEMKTAKGRQQDSQKAFQKRVEALGHRYVICRSLDDFMQKLKEWLGTNTKEQICQKTV